MSVANRFDRFDAGQWAGNLIFVILLESHLVSRPLVFFIGPLATLICIYLIAPRVPAKRWGRACIVAVSISVAGFLLTRYVFR
jgi:ABC-type enterobactin transport system permease subunit